MSNCTPSSPAESRDASSGEAENHAGSVKNPRDAKAKSSQSGKSRSPSRMAGEHGRLKPAGDILDEAPPNSKQAERGLLGSIMVDGSVMAAVVDVVSVDDFFDPQYRRVYASCLEIHREGKPVDALLLQDRLITSGAFDGSASWLLAELADATFVARNAPHYAQEIAAKAQLRRMAEAGVRLIQISRDELRASKDLDGLLAEADDVFVTIGRASPESAQPKAYRHLSSAELFSGDFRPNYIIEGVLAEGEQCLWAGPEKGMKTSTAMDAAVAIDQGGYWLGYFPVAQPKRVAVMSGEAGAVFLQDLGRRICQAAGRDPTELGIEWFLDLPILGDERHRAP